MIIEKIKKILKKRKFNMYIQILFVHLNNKRNKPVCGCDQTQNSLGYFDGSHFKDYNWFNYKFNWGGEVNMMKLNVKEKMLFTPFNLWVKNKIFVNKINCPKYSHLLFFFRKQIDITINIYFTFYLKFRTIDS